MKLSGLNLAEVSDSFEPVPAGTYDQVVFAVEQKTSQNGNEMLFITSKIDDPQASEYNGRNLFFNLMLMEKSMWVLKSFLVACGFDKSTIEDPKFELDSDDLVGKHFRANVGLRMYDRGDGSEPEERNEVKTNKFMPALSGSVVGASKKKSGIL